MFGFITFSVFTFIAFVLISYFKVFYRVVKLIQDAYLLILESIDIKRRENLFVKREINKKLGDTKSKPPISWIAKNKLEILKIKYPYADEELFNKFLSQYDYVPMYATEKNEHDIIKSHFNNEAKMKVKTVRKFKMNEVLRFCHFDMVECFPLTMKFYKIGYDYILSIKHISTEEHIMYQSRSHNTLLTLCNEIYENVGMKKGKFLISELYDEKKYNNIYKLN